MNQKLYLGGPPNKVFWTTLPRFLVGKPFSNPFWNPQGSLSWKLEQLNLFWKVVGFKKMKKGSKWSISLLKPFLKMLKINGAKGVVLKPQTPK